MSRAAVVIVALLAFVPLAPGQSLEKDVLTTSAGDLEITFLGHGSLFLTVAGTVVQVDPYGRVADYTTLPKASVVLITHAHRDHLDPEALAAIRTPETVVIVAPVCADKVEGATVMSNGEHRTVQSFEIAAVPAYNLVHHRPDGSPYHPRGEGNGYVLTFGDTSVYIAGDTELIPEMSDLEDIDIAFLPMNLPYTMTPEMVADAARIIGPRILYPYHYGDTDPDRLVELLAANKDIEVRIRRMR